MVFLLIMWSNISAQLNIIQKVANISCTARDKQLDQ